MKRIFAIILFLIISFSMSSQTGNLYIGLSSVAIDDNAKSSVVLNKDNISYLPIPTKLSLIRIYSNDLFFRVDGGYLKLNEQLYGERYRNPGDMFSFDGSIGYRLRLKKESPRFDRKKNFFSSYSIYGAALTGLGYTYKTLYPIEFTSAYTLNAGFNLTFNFLSSKIAFNFQTLGKFGLHKMFPHHGTNYIDFSIGIFYKLMDYNKNSLKAKTFKREARKNQNE
jgi:hypothetical protein